MKFQKNAVHGFTSKANGLVRELKNDIFVSEAYKPEPGVPAPPREKFLCLWDTGATNTVITKKVVDGLSLKPSGRTVVRTVGQGSDFNEYEVNTYLVNLFLPNNVVVAAVPVSEGGIAGGDILIGMDIIAMGDFAITNCDGRSSWTFRMPSVEEIDFVQEIQEHNRKYRHLLLSPEEKRKLRNKAKRGRRG
ncbi:MAG: aspartyl protease family protein [Candidatus Binatia bacterium]